MLEVMVLKCKQVPHFSFLGLQKTVLRWRVNSQTRRVLRDLEDWQLDDIGIDRKAAMSEGAKPFWQ